MSLNLFISNTFDGAGGALIDRLKQDYRRGEGMYFVIVPDRFTLSYECNVLSSLALTSAANIEICSLSRLANVYADRSRKYLTVQSGVMLMRKVIGENRDKLLCYSRAAANIGFTNEMYAVISDIRNSNIDAGTLRETAEKITDASVRNKTLDIATVYSAYIKELQDKYYDSTSKFDALTDLIAEHPDFDGCRVYIGDCYAFTNMEYKVISELMRTAVSVNAGLVEKRAGGNARIYPNNVSDKLAAIAENLGVAVNRKYCGQELPPDFAAIEEGLFSYGVTDVAGREKSAVFLGEAPSVYDEIAYTASRIRAYVAEKGYRYRDIAVVCCDMEGYEREVRDIFDRYGIPYYIDDKTPVTGSVGVRALTDAIDLIASGYGRKEFFTYVNGALSGAESEDKDAFLNYCAKYNIDRSRFLSPFTLGDEEERSAAEMVRLSAVAGLELLAYRGERSVSEHIAAYERFLEARNYGNAINAFAERQFNAGRKKDSEITKQSPKKLLSVMEEMRSMMGDAVVSAEECAAILRSALDTDSISLIPQYTDCVFVGGAKESRYDDCRALFVLGANSDAIPRDSREEGILGSKENKIWTDNGVVVEPNKKFKNMLDRFYILQLLIKPSEKLYVSYSTRNGAYSPVLPSTVMKQLSEILRIKVQPIGRTVEIANGRLKEFTATYDNAVAECARDISARRSGNYSSRDADYDIIAEIGAEHNASIALILGEDSSSDDIADTSAVWNRHGEEILTSVSQIEKYFKCPRLMFCDYGLSIKDSDSTEINVADLGSIMHEILEKFFARHRYGEDADIRAEVAAIADGVFDSDRYRAMMDGGAAEQAIRDIRESCVFVVNKVYDMTMRSDFRPEELEFAFGEDSPYTITVGGKVYRFRGKIDRIDGSGDDFFVIDYKSGTKAKLGYPEVYSGERIQLCVYLDAYSKITGKRPCGAFYLSVPVKFASRDVMTERYKYKGLCIGDKEILDRIDRTGKEGSVPYKVKKDGALEGAKDVRLIAEREFDTLTAYVRKLIAKAVDEINSGHIAPSPLKGACEYCKYGECCRSEGREIAERVKPKAGSTSFVTEEI